ncbi:MAG: rRNA maturation RNase YbeY [Sedimentisphaerales bacterium]|nr:rRNA maturation RNase YbeY [Sedimentisphaerales bacterium]
MNQFDINITDEQSFLTFDAECLRKTAAFVLGNLGIAEGAVSIAVVDSVSIRQLKKQFFDMDVVTDVISFDLSDEEDTGGDADSESVSGLDCEIVVNAQLALEIAEGDEKNALAELNLYVVHGLLHQLAYDDQTPQQAKKMHQKEDQLLEELGYGKVYSRRKG